jgi:hypothetical protein
MDAAESLNNATRTFIYRCRPGDDCGGTGDRLGGIMGGAFYALQMGRSFRVLWPGLEHVFKPGHIHWTFEPATLNIPYEDKEGNEIDATRIGVRTVGIRQDVYKDRPDIGLVNDLNNRQITDPQKAAIIERFTHVFFHSNRGPSRQMFSQIHKRYNWAAHFPDTDESYSAVYRCVFEGLFRPTDEFLDSVYKSVGRSPVPFSHITGVVDNDKFVSMAYHHRVSDDIAAANSDRDAITEHSISKIVEMAHKHGQLDKQLNLYFVTNSIHSANRVIENRDLQSTFHAIYTQELSAPIHVNYGTGNGEHATLSGILSLLQAMRDWWIMRLADVLIFPKSGFSISAALLASHEQVRYEDAGHTWESKENYWSLCVNRFC